MKVVTVLQPEPFEFMILEHLYYSGIIPQMSRELMRNMLRKCMPTVSNSLPSLVQSNQPASVPGADIPTFEVEAEGFYPQEGRYILLEGEIVLDEEPITFATGKAGLTGETVEQDGSLSDVIAVDIREQLAGQGYQNVQPIEGPIEFTLRVGGHLSQCEATQTVIWP